MSLRTVAFLLLSAVPVFFASCSKTPEELVAKHTEKGDSYLNQEKFQEAVIEYKNAAKAAPRNAAVRWKLAKAALAARDVRTGFQELQKTVELDPANYEAQGKLGEIYVAAGKPEDAAGIADNLVKSRPQDAQGYVLKAGIAARAGKVDESIGYLKKAVELDPRKARPMLTIGNLYFVKRDRKSALEWYDRALAAEPGTTDVHITRGNYFFASGDRQEGEKAYRKAIEVAKEKEPVRIALAEHYLFQGRIDDAEQELNAVIKEMNSQKARKVLAEIKLETGKVADAGKIVDAILKENEKDLDGKYLKGRIALVERRFDEAKGLFGEVVKQDAGMGRAHLFNGIAEIAQGHMDIGKKEVAEAVRLNPDDVRARLILGDLFLKSNAPADAEKEAGEVLRRYPSNLGAAVVYGDSFLLRKDWRKAEQVYQSIIKQKPKSPVGYYKMGLARKLQRKPAEAAGYLAQANELNPGDMSMAAEYVMTLVAAGKTEQAGKIVAAYVAKEPKNPAVREMEGQFHLAGGRKAEAEAAFLKAVEAAPDYMRPYYSLGVLYASQKRLPEAEARLRTVVGKNDKDIGAHALLGMLLQTMGKPDEANKHYRRVLDFAPRNPLAANNLASNLADRGGNLDEALKFAQVAREAAPEDPNVADTLGWIYYRKGLVDTAFPLIAEAAKKLQKNAVVRYHHGMALAGKGRSKEAAAELKAALAIDARFSGAEEAKKTLASLK